MKSIKGKFLGKSFIFEYENSDQLRFLGLKLKDYVDIIAGTEEQIFNFYNANK